jgi:two-component system, NtrC family, response regulator GlrR
MKCLKRDTTRSAAVKLEIRVRIYPGFPVAILRVVDASPERGTRSALPSDMKELDLTALQAALASPLPSAPPRLDDTVEIPAIDPTVEIVIADALDAAPSLGDDEALMSMQLTEAKRLAASAFERRYLVRVMERAGGKVSEGARLSGLDRTNFRRLLQRHGLR